MATFFNQATLSYSGGVASSNIVSGELLDSLSATKTAVTDSYTVGSDVTYVISIVNSGTMAFDGLTLSDDLGAYAFGTGTLRPLDYVGGSVLYYINGVLQSAPSVSTDSGVAFSGISVPAGGNATVIYSARVNDFAPPASDSEIVNTVTISGGGITPFTATETISASDSPVLSIAKSLSPLTVSENSRLTYTFVIQNTGNTEAGAADNIVVTDNFDPILSDLVVTLNGVTLALGTGYTYDKATGAFATVAGVITVPAATYTQDATSGEWEVNPGTAVLTVTGTI